MIAYLVTILLVEKELRGVKQFLILDLCLNIWRLTAKLFFQDFSQLFVQQENN